MRTLKFKKLTIISNLQKKARQLEFSDRYNLILAEGTNSVGKSSVVKNLFWCFGCEPRFDDKWNGLNCKAIVEFEVGNKKYWVARDDNRFFLSEDGIKYKSYTGLAGDFSKRISEIVNFNALLPVRNQDEVVIPPPAFYFLPFYIDQKQSWSNAWVSFDKLGQFADWKKEIIQYHSGMIKENYFDLTKDIYEKKREKAAIKNQIDKYETAISIVSDFIPSIETTVNLEEFDEIEEELKYKILELHNLQELVFEEFAELRADKAHIQSQLAIANEAVSKLEKDYEFAEETDNEIECPTCGVIHDNTLVNRFALLKDKEQAEQVAKRLEKALKKYEKSVIKKEEELKEIRNKIEALNEKYYKKEDNGNTITFQNILDSVAAHSVTHKVNRSKSIKLEKFYSLEADEKTLGKDRSSTSKETRKTVRDKFLELFPSYVAKLKAFGVNTSNIKSPENHARVAKSGGAAESTRAMLAYYVSLYNLISMYSEEILSPLVIDTPNQHEQAAKHYESIVSLIMNNTPANSQVFLCGMDSDKLSQMKNQGQVHFLEKEHALLEASEYEGLNEIYSSIFE
ncbi:hypothetical protein SAMN05421831_102295 [Allopseudospirillum japonicum]|uniref:AAA domain-containing protein n=1 Tax=Allopseudospirillum japonicum TaxID=64971 RepID=A0A1H6R577_9GAMM|nr:hypothetical protein [Allopseudospirillum japonicum]SEI48374.1 hypothetical protein SAMN05421831_102295 [Allopseudospirillum japonicum]